VSALMVRPVAARDTWRMPRAPRISLRADLENRPGDVRDAATRLLLGHQARWSARGPVRLGDIQPDLLAGVDGRSAEGARRELVARTHALEPRPWDVPLGRAESFQGWLGVMVLDGLLARSVGYDDLCSQELIGPGDLLRPWDDEGAVASVPATTTWSVLAPTRVALLDGRFASVACRWPTVVAALFARTVDRSRALSVHLAISQARQAEVRLLLLFWHLADRWGRVGRDGTVVSLRLTHERIAQLVCLRRPTVSMTLQRLAQDGTLIRRPDGSWVLPKPPPDATELTRGGVMTRGVEEPVAV